MAGTGSLAAGRALVTGGTGFIGSHLVRRLLNDGVEVHTITSTVSSVFPPRLVSVSNDIAVHEANLCDRGAVDRLAEQIRPTHVFHLGAYTHVGKSWGRVDECVQTNVQGTVNLLQALDRVGYQRFVNVGTSEIYGDVEVPFREDGPVRPISPYAVSKYAGEEFCRMFHEGRGWPIVRVRPFNAYGPMQSPDRVIPEIIVRGLRNQPLKMTQGRQTREFNYVEDLVDGLVRAATVEGVDGELFNLGCGEEIAMRDLAELVLDVAQAGVRPEFGALEDRPTEIWRMYAEASKARDQLGWSSQWSLRDGLATTIDWYRSELERPGSLFTL
jgi:nucleoside-diphosphate-sugar epimerase